MNAIEVDDLRTVFPEVAAGPQHGGMLDAAGDHAHLRAHRVRRAADRGDRGIPERPTEATLQARRLAEDRRPERVRAPDGGAKRPMGNSPVSNS